MIFSLANGEITLVQPCKILQDIDSHYIQCLSKIFPEKCVSQLWKSYFVLTHKMSEIIKLKSRKISDKNPKFYSVICASQRPTTSWVLSEILHSVLVLLIKSRKISGKTKFCASQRPTISGILSEIYGTLTLIISNPRQHNSGKCPRKN